MLVNPQVLVENTNMSMDATKVTRTWNSKSMNMTKMDRNSKGLTMFEHAAMVDMMLAAYPTAIIITNAISFLSVPLPLVRSGPCFSVRSCFCLKSVVQYVL